MRLFSPAIGYSAAGTLVETQESKKSEDHGDSVAKFKRANTGERNERHPDMVTVLNITETGFVMGGIYGGFQGYIKAIDNFIDTNETTKFLNKIEANRQLSQAGFKGLVHQGIITGLKLGALSGTFMFSTTAIATYRGKSGIIEYPICTGVMASLARFHLGVRGMFSGLVLGSLSGLVLGTLTWSVLKLFGSSMEDVRSNIHKLRTKRMEIIEEYQRKQKKTSLSGVLDTTEEKLVRLSDLFEENRSIEDGLAKLKSE